jgi:hypothetical protein
MSDRWEEGFDTWTPRAEPAGGDDTDTDLDRAELLRLARELAASRRVDPGAGHDELEELKQSLRERAAAVAARERELELLQRKVESGHASVRDRFRRPPPPAVDEEAIVARERAALERAQALDARTRELEARAATVEAEAARLAEREAELEAELAAAQARLAETEAERELAERERERLEERDKAAHDVERSLATARIALEQERERLEARERELTAQVRTLQNRVAAEPEPQLDPRLETLEAQEAKLAARERELLLLRQGIDAERNALLERERALRRRELAEVRESFTPPLAPPSFSEGLAALAHRKKRA